MKAIQNYTIKNLEKEKPSKMAILIIIAYFAIVLMRHKEVDMSAQENKKPVDEKKQPEQEEKGFLTKAKETLTSETALKVYAYGGTICLVAGVVIGIIYGFGALAFSLIGGGLVFGVGGFYKMPNRPSLRINGSLHENVQKIMDKLGIQQEQEQVASN